MTDTLQATILKIQYSQAIRTKDRKEMATIETQLGRLGVHPRWLSEDVLLWEDEKTYKRRRKKEATVVVADDKFYDNIVCKVCGSPVEKTGKQGRPPTKCMKHR